MAKLSESEQQIYDVISRIGPVGILGIFVRVPLNFEQTAQVLFDGFQRGDLFRTFSEPCRYTLTDAGHLVLDGAAGEGERTT